MSACYCDIEPMPSMYRAMRPLARKTHRCTECGAVIHPGDRYERVTGVWDGVFDHHKTCAHCLAMRDLVESRAHCFCWTHGGLRDELWEWISEEWMRAPGLAMALGRIEIERKRTNAATATA
jgi:hypothetical protein